MFSGYIRLEKEFRYELDGFSSPFHLSATHRIQFPFDMSNEHSRKRNSGQDVYGKCCLSNCPKNVLFTSFVENLTAESMNQCTFKGESRSNLGTPLLWIFEANLS
jgi:hypothetical protein